MSIRNNKKVIFGAISGIVASVTAGVLVKNSIDKKLKSEDNDLKEKKQKKEKKSKNVYYTVHLNVATLIAWLTSFLSLNPSIAEV